MTGRNENYKNIQKGAEKERLFLLGIFAPKTLKNRAERLKNGVKFGIIL